jgi:mediator of RNA polymerase II transcription subunit 18
MHEFSLYSQLAPARHEQTLHVLAGVTGSQPFAYQDQHLLFADIRSKLTEPKLKEGQPKKKAPAAVSNDRFIHDLSRAVNITEGALEPIASWQARVPNMPDASVTAYAARDVTELELTNTDNYEDTTIFAMKGHLYKLGHRLVSGNVIIRVFRVFYSVQQMSTDKLLEGPPLQLSELEVLDTSGTYVVEVSIRLEDRNKSALVEQARGELQSFQEQVKGVLDLRVPDRFALDTRVRGV